MNLISTVSIVIPTYNRKKDLIRLLKSITNSTYPQRLLEIIIVDNGKNLKQTDFKKSLHAVSWRLITPDKNLYCNGGRLYGVKHATGTYCFFVDDDNILAADCIEKLVLGLKEDHKAGMVGPLMLIYKDKNRVWSAGGMLSRLRLPSYLYNGIMLKDIKIPLTIDNVDFFPNAFMIRRQLLKSVALDPVNFPHNWGEPDFCLRVKELGYKLVTISNAYEWHDIEYGGPLTRTTLSNIYDQASSRIIFRKKFYSSFLDWALFWVIVFPVSTLYYVKAILLSGKDAKATMLKYYFSATFHAVLHNQGSLDKPANAG